MKYVRTDMLSGGVRRIGMNHEDAEIARDLPYGRMGTAADIGRVIRHKRRELKTQQETAAGLAGVGTKFLSQLENGKETEELAKAAAIT